MATRNSPERATRHRKKASEMETIESASGASNEHATPSEGSPTRWLSKGARTSFKALDTWVREPQDKQKSRSRLGAIGAAIFVAIAIIIKNPLVGIPVLSVAILTALMVIALYGDVLLKGGEGGAPEVTEKVQPEPPRTSPVQDQEEEVPPTAEPFPGHPQEPSEPARVSLVKEPFEGPPEGSWMLSDEGGGQALDAPAPEAATLPQAAFGGLLEDEPTQRLEPVREGLVEDAPTVRLRPSAQEEEATPEGAALAAEETGAAAPELPEPTPPADTEPPAEPLAGGEQQGLWSDPQAPLSGRIELLEGGSWAEK